MNRCKISWQILSAMLLTALCWVAILAATDIVGGERSILITDLSQQYIEYHAALRQNGYTLFTWDSGMGMNFLGIFAYYLASPLTAVIFLFPENMLPTALLCIISLKIVLSAGTMAAYLSTQPRMSCTVVVAFSLSYALSAYSMANCFNLMWLDGVVLLPVLVVAARQIYENRHFFPLVLLLVLLFVSNYYIAYSVGIFLFLLYLSWIVAHKSGTPVAAVGRFLGAAVLAAGLSAVLLLPAFLSLQGSHIDIGGISLSGGIACAPQTLLQKWIFTPFDSATHSGTPNLFCGTITVLLIPLFFCCRSIPKRERLTVGGLLLFMTISMVFSATDLAWHAFQFPTWFVCRYSFTAIFLLCDCAARTTGAMHSISPAYRKTIPVCIGCLLLFLAVILRLHYAVALTVLAAFCGYILLLFAYKQYRRKRILRHLTAIALVAAVAGQMLLGGVYTLQELDKQLHFESDGDYPTFRQRSAALVSLLDIVDDGTFYRVGNSTARNANDGLSAGYHAVSHYSSLSYQSTHLLMKRLGMHCTVGNKIFRYYGSSSPLDAVMNVRYIFDTDDLRYGLQDTGLAYGDTRLYENRYALPLMYAANDAILQFTAQDGNPFAAQEALYSSLIGEAVDLYTELPVVTGPAPGIIGDGGILTITIDNPKAQNVLLYFQNNLPEFSQVYLNGKRLNVYNDRLVRGVIDLGRHEAEQITVKIPVGATSTFSAPIACGLNESTYVQAVQKLQSGTPLQMIVEDTRVVCKVQASQEQVLFTSIPADKGWSVYIDGKRMEWQAVDNALMAVLLPEGTHTVEWVFCPRGLIAGAVISGTSLLLCIALAVWLHIRKKQKNPAL